MSGSEILGAWGPCSIRVEIVDRVLAICILHRLLISRNTNRCPTVKATELPRFLFRGFHDESGGGDPRLNNQNGVLPAAWLPENQDQRDGLIPEDIRGLSGYEFHQTWRNHISYRAKPSAWSSWTGHFPTAVNFALRYTCRMDTADWDATALRERPGTIAILDTHKMWPNLVDRAMHMIHVPTIKPGCCQMEYLLWGPITDPDAYHCVSIEDIRASAGDPEWPLNSPEEPHRVSEPELDYVCIVAWPFAPQPDPDRPGKFRGSWEMWLTLFAAERE